MKAKLLKKLRRAGRAAVTIYEITTQRGIITGMSYGFNGKEYSGLFEFGDTEEAVKEKACMIYLQTNIERIRKRYWRYSRYFKLKHNQ